MSLFENKAVNATKSALAASGFSVQVVKLRRAATEPSDTATLLGVATGAVVSVRVFMVGGQPAMALVAGDRRCASEALPRALNMAGDVVPATAEEVLQATGCPAEAVSPVGASRHLPTAIDVSLKRFPTVFAPAGHCRYVFATSTDELKKLTGGIVSYNITEGEVYHPTATRTADA